MLRQRVITAVLLLLVLLPVLFYPEPQPFMVLAMLMIAAGGWEWGRLNSLSRLGSCSLGLVSTLPCGLAWWLGWDRMSTPLFWLIGSAGWVLIGGLLLARGAGFWSRSPLLLRLLAGVLVLGLAWLALAQARHRGINFLLSILVLVWVADIFAYFAGHAFGRRKLAPAISPGKSWEGVWGGMAGVALLALAWIAADRFWQASAASLYSLLLARGPLLLLLGLVYLTAMSVLGDLLESLVKRSAGMKDSSGLLPGHGGVLDRIDALLPVLPTAMLLVSIGVAR